MKSSPLPRFLACVLLAIATSLSAAPRDNLWQQVMDAEANRLPQTALAALEPIIEQSVADGSHAEALKAITKRVQLQTEIEGSSAEAAILRFQAELAQTPPDIRPLMQAILAHQYWNYFQQNRRQFLQRTQTAEAPGPDFQTWDLARILAEIDLHFTATLENEKLLQSTPISSFNDFLLPGAAPDAYRPTLYDFLAYEALAFYQAGEQAATIAEDAFQLAADSPIFDDTQTFLAWHPDTSSPNPSPELKAIQLYQDLLRFHQADADRSAYFDADLSRLEYARNSATGETKDARYVAALERFIASTAQHEISSRARAQLARFHFQNDAPDQAHALASQGLAAFPDSVGAAACHNLLQEIEAKSLSIATEDVWNAPWPTLDITYKNLEKIHFRVVPIDLENLVSRSHWRLYQQSVDELLALSPVLQWQANLPATTDFRERTESLPAPQSLKPGFYSILASSRDDFSTENNHLSQTAVWVSDLALVTQNLNNDSTAGGFILNAISGEPIENASIRTWIGGNNGKFHPGPNSTTDANGHFDLPSKKDQRSLFILAEKDGQSIATNGPIWTNYRQNHDKPTLSQTVFFTDRALYRPGQTVNYKGICIEGDQQDADYRVLKNKTVEIIFRDSNYREIATAKHRTNDYGSFSGSFTTPSSGLSGQLRLSVTKGPDGSTSVSVEEYKRPKFQVALDAPTDAPKLEETVAIQGHATAYTGSSIGGAKVAWRVERSVQFPRWCWWIAPEPPTAIAHGTAETAADGSFDLSFIAHPDPSVARATEPVFTYQIHADVTDTTGETRSATSSARAGYTALQANLNLDNWQTTDAPVAVSTSTASFDGQARSAKGTLSIYKLKQPATTQRRPLEQPRRWWGNSSATPAYDPTNLDTWEKARRVAHQQFETDAEGTAQSTFKLPAGPYRIELETQDRFGATVTARSTFTVVDPAATRFTTKIPNFFDTESSTYQPGETATALWGTGYPSGRAFVEILQDGKSLQSFWTDAQRTQQKIEFPVTESMRGGVTLNIVYVRENRAYLESRYIDVPWTNKSLALTWETFRSKLDPGQAETWTATLSDSLGAKASAEMVAALYDASLDQFLPHSWPDSFNIFRRDYSGNNAQFHNARRDFNHLRSHRNHDIRPVDWSYRSFPPEVLTAGGEEVFLLSPFSVEASDGAGYYATSTLSGSRIGRSKSPRRPNPLDTVMGLGEGNAMKMEISEAFAYKASADSVSPPPPPLPDLSQIAARKNLAETAFFYPHLLADENGVVKIQFTMPEALTQWRFLGFAHDQKLRSGFLTDTAVTAKDLMVEPNPPRFLREGDTVEFTVKVSNQSEQTQSGQVQLTFSDANTLAPADTSLGNLAPTQTFEIPAKQSRSYSWRIAVPDGAGVLTYKAVGATSSLSDGEEGYLPVLSRRILVTESLPLPIRGPTTKDFTFTKLLDSANSDTLQHQSLTVQMTSQPAWYAIQALPYLMEFPHECSEQLFSRYYANTLAAHIANSDPKIRRVFDLWKNTPALDSPLEKNQDLKSVLIEETPWLRDAQNESQARRQLGQFFDPNRLADESSRALKKLAERQLPDGLWSWFPGGSPSEYITLHIATGFGRLRHLGVAIDAAPALRSHDALDAWMDKRYDQILEHNDHPEDYIPSHLDALYLYGRSFYLDEQPIAKNRRKAVDFYLAQARKNWTQVASRQSEAHLALALQRFGDQETPAAILASLRERALHSEELGMYWAGSDNAWWWYHAPIETQALMIEAFSEIAHDTQAVEDLQVWLLKQKQTQNWKTTKATADAVYALLLQGRNLLSSDALVAISLGGQTILPETVEAGTGFYQKTFTRQEIQPAQGHITLTKTDPGVSWGSVHWQYLEDVAKITPHQGTPLTLKKTLFLKENSPRGPVLKPINGPLAVGDELVVRLELRSDRDMEFLHLKDQRGSGTEPVNVLSGYRYQDRLGYYESTRDTASHFFIDYLPKGTYVFEYSTRVQLKGTYQSGIAEIQSMYAPEFNSHSASTQLEVK